MQGSWGWKRIPPRRKGFPRTGTSSGRERSPFSSFPQKTHRRGSLREHRYESQNISLLWCAFDSLPVNWRTERYEEFTV